VVAFIVLICLVRHIVALFCLIGIYIVTWIYYERLLAEAFAWVIKKKFGWTVVIAAASVRIDFALRKPRITCKLEQMYLRNPASRRCWSSEFAASCEEFSFELMLEKWPREGDVLHFASVSFVGVAVTFERAKDTRQLNFPWLDSIKLAHELLEKGINIAEKQLNCVVVKVIAAHQLSARSTSIDPRVLVRYQNTKEATKALVETRQPVWEETFDFYATDPKTAVGFILEDFDVVGSSSFIGECWIPLDALADGKAMHRRIMLHNRKGKEDPLCGELELALHWVSKIDPEWKVEPENEFRKCSGLAQLQQWDWNNDAAAQFKHIGFPYLLSVDRLQFIDLNFHVDALNPSTFSKKDVDEGSVNLDEAPISIDQLVLNGQNNFWPYYHQGVSGLTKTRFVRLVREQVMKAVINDHRGRLLTEIAELTGKFFSKQMAKVANYEENMSALQDRVNLMASKLANRVNDTRQMTMNIGHHGASWITSAPGASVQLVGQSAQMVGHGVKAIGEGIISAPNVSVQLLGQATDASVQLLGQGVKVITSAPGASVQLLGQGVKAVQHAPGATKNLFNVAGHSVIAASRFTQRASNRFPMQVGGGAEVEYARVIEGDYFKQSSPLDVEGNVSVKGDVYKNSGLIKVNGDLKVTGEVYKNELLQVTGAIYCTNFYNNGAGYGRVVCTGKQQNNGVDFQCIDRSSYDRGTSPLSPRLSPGDNSHVSGNTSTEYDPSDSDAAGGQSSSPRGENWRKVRGTMVGSPEEGDGGATGLQKTSISKSMANLLAGSVVMRGYMQKQHMHSRLGQRRWVKRFYQLELLPDKGGILKYAKRDEGEKTAFKSAVQLSQPKNRLLVCWVTETRTIGLAFADGNEMLLRCR
jgi:hypothetical protein